VHTGLQEHGVRPQVRSPLSLRAMRGAIRVTAIRILNAMECRLYLNAIRWCRAVNIVSLFAILFPASTLRPRQASIASAACIRVDAGLWCRFDKSVHHLMDFP
jgi:hypothetical protein